MTAISQAQIDGIQSQFTTVEQFAAYLALLLHRVNPTLQVVEGQNLTEFVCQASTFTANDGSERLVVRLSLPLIEGYAESEDPLWLNVTPISDTVIPAGYL